MKTYITVNGISVEVQNKKIKNLHLHVTPAGKVYASVPMRTPQHVTATFVRENLSWIEAQLKRFEGRPDKAWYEAQRDVLEEKIRQLLPEWEARTGLFCDSWHTRYMTSRWGSCIPSKKRLCFNLQLLDQPEACLEYVILHELLHLRHPGHGDAFKKDLDFYMPGWRAISRSMK